HFDSPRRRHRSEPWGAEARSPAVAVAGGTTRERFLRADRAGDVFLREFPNQCRSTFSVLSASSAWWSRYATSPLEVRVSARVDVETAVDPAPRRRDAALGAGRAIGRGAATLVSPENRSRSQRAALNLSSDGRGGEEARQAEPTGGRR